MLEETPTNRPRLLGREKQTKKTGAHGRRKEDAEMNRRTRAQKRKIQKIYANVVLANGPVD